MELLSLIGFENLQNLIVYNKLIFNYFRAKYPVRKALRIEFAIILA